jgi:hypothetical protein
MVMVVPLLLWFVPPPPPQPATNRLPAIAAASTADLLALVIVAT